MNPIRQSDRKKGKQPQFSGLPPPTRKTRNKRKKSHQKILDHATGEIVAETDTESEVEENPTNIPGESENLNRTRLLPVDPAESASILAHTFIPTLEDYGDDDGEGQVEAGEVQVLIPNTSRKIRRVLDHIDDFATPVAERSKLIAVRNKITKKSATVQRIDDELVADIQKIFEGSTKHTSTSTTGIEGEVAVTTAKKENEIEDLIDLHPDLRKEAYRELHNIQYFSEPAVLTTKRHRYRDEGEEGAKDPLDIPISFLYKADDDKLNTQKSNTSLSGHKRFSGKFRYHR